LSIGRFCPDYLNHQRVFAAFDGSTPVAFVSFHTGLDGNAAPDQGIIWTLDLMRHMDDTATGTMHKLVCMGLEAARLDGVTTVSLAAVPAPASHLPFATRIADNAAGLRRFKSTFAPRWHPLYMTAASPLRLGLTMMALAQGIHRPAPLKRQGNQNVQLLQHDEACLTSASIGLNRGPS